MTTDVGGGIIKSVTINGQDCTALVTAIDIKESIYTGAISAALSLADGAGFRKQAELDKGNQKIEIRIADRITNQDKTIRLQQSKITPSSRERENLDTYHVEGLPSEFIKNNEKTLKKAYKNMKMSDIFKKQFDEYIKGSDTVKKDLVENEETEKEGNFYPTNDTPRRGMEWTNKNSKPAGKQGARLFYQTTNGYYSKSLQSIIDQSANDTLTYATQNIGSSGSDPTKNIISYYEHTLGNNFDPNNRGAVGTKNILIDPLTGKRKTLVRKGADGKVTQTNVMYVPFSDSDSNFHKRRESEAVKTSREPVAENEPAVTKGHKLDNKVITIQVPGQLKYEAGKKIKIRIPNSGELKGDSDLTDEYVITSNRIRVYYVDQDVKMVNIMELKSVKKAEG